MSLNLCTGSKLLDAQSMAASFESKAFQLPPNVRELRIELDVSSSTHVGTFYVKTGNGQDTAKWQTEPLSPTPTVASGSAYTFHIDIETDAGMMLLGYTATSGAGAASALVTTKHHG